MYLNDWISLYVINYLDNLEFRVKASVRKPAIKCMIVFFGNGWNDKGGTLWCIMFADDAVLNRENAVEVNNLY